MAEIEKNNMQETIEVFILTSKASIINAREMARKIAEKMGFDNYDQYRIATAISELAENSVRYAGSGTMELRRLNRGLEVICQDEGGGMLQRRGIAHGLGIGLKSVENLMDEVIIGTSPQGTCIRVRKWLK